MNSVKAMKFNDVASYIEKLSYSAFRHLVDHYAKNNQISCEKKLNQITIADFQKRLNALGVNAVCPHCKSNLIVKNGNRSNIQRYKCKSCGTQLPYFQIPSLAKLNGTGMSGLKYWK